ncbi:MAG: beta-propeller domain-containing protein [Actinomycetia bacterium]|nr:beta-propeller domain-containing protein [Actinomycetes bacterium]
MNRSLALATAAALLVVGCSNDSKSSTDSTASTVKPSGPSSGGFGSSRLVFFEDCPDLLSYLRTEALERVTAWGLDGGGPIFYGRDAIYPTAEAAPTADSAGTDSGAEPPKSDGSGDPSYSGTNTQEVGVDEGDVVETDGKHVFVVSQDGIRIVDVASAAVIANIENLPDGSHQLLLDGTRLLVISQSYNSSEDTIVSLYDVNDAANPTLLRRSHLEGRLVASRSIDGQARLVLTSTIANRLQFVTPDQFGLDEASALQANKDVINNSTIEEWLPRYFDEATDGAFGAMSASLDCSTVAAPRDFAGLGISWIASMDLQGDSSPVGSAGIVSYGDVVYASPTSIYLATVPWDWTNTAPTNTQPPTLIHQFALGANGTASYIASGEVNGQLLNQFAMSEYEGDLRVATTLSDWNTGASESFVQVLRPQGNELVQIGKVGGLGLTEQIYAVRFLGTQAYVVTFRQTDPLYVIDLADPTNPVVTGELKIPGYSAYLHPVGDGLLLGVGQSADLSGFTNGTQLSLFDVSDPANPQLISSLPIGGSSEAEWDHKAFLYWAEDGTIVIPVSPWWGGCGPAIDCLSKDVVSSAGGAVVAQLQGRTLVGRGTIQHEAQTDTGCWNPLQRSMIIDSEIVTIGLDQVQFTDRASLTVRGSVQWGDPDMYGCYYYMEG